jgi:hypothetical protein
MTIFRVMEDIISDIELKWIKDICPKPDKEMMINFTRHCMMEMVTKKSHLGMSMIKVVDIEKIDSILEKYSNTI